MIRSADPLPAAGFNQSPTAWGMPEFQPGKSRCEIQGTAARRVIFPVLVPRGIRGSEEMSATGMPRTPKMENGG